MKTATIFSAIAAMTIATSAMASPNTTQQSGNKLGLRYKIAVNQGKWDQIRSEQWTLPEVERNGLQAMIIDKLQSTGQFLVMERENNSMDAMNQEKQIQAQGGGTAKTSPTVAARYIITPEVTGFEFSAAKKNGFSIGGIGLGKNESKMRVEFTLRIYDAQSSALLDSAKGEAIQKVSGNTINVNIGGIRAGQQDQKNSTFSKAFAEAVNKSIDAMCARLNRDGWSATVAAVVPSTNRVIFNAGELSGVQVGQEFQVFATSGDVRDDETGEIISKGDETSVGKIRVIKVERGAATCEVISGKGFAKKNIVRPL